MADIIYAKDESKPFPKHPEGTFGAVCVDVIDLGDNVESFPGEAPKIAHKVAVVFHTGERDPETGRPFELSKEFTLSMFAAAALRKFLGMWRGKTYTDDEAKAGAPLHKLEGVNATLTVEHKTSAKGKIYANILNISPWPKDAPKRTASGYERGEFWTKKKTEYAEASAKHRAANAPRREPEAVLVAAGAEDDASLPF